MPRHCTPDIIDGITLEIERARTLLDMANDKIHDLAAETASPIDGVWLYTSDALEAHLRKIHALASGNYPRAVGMADLVAECDAASAAFSAVRADTCADEDCAEHRAAERRYLDACNAIRSARPTTPADLAAQLRWLLTPDQEDLYQPPLNGIMANVADQLEALAGEQAA